MAGLGGRECGGVGKWIYPQARPRGTKPSREHDTTVAVASVFYRGKARLKSAHRHPDPEFTPVSAAFTCSYLFSLGGTRDPQRHLIFFGTLTAQEKRAKAIRVECTANDRRGPVSCYPSARRNGRRIRGGIQKLKSSRVSSSKQPPVRLNGNRKPRRDPSPLTRRSNRLVSVARSFAAKILDFELTNQATADMAGQWRQQIDAQERKVIEWFAPSKQAAFKAHAIICHQESEALAPYREARRVLNSKLAAWQDAQSRRSRSEGGQQPDLEVQSDENQTIGAATATERGFRVEGINFRENWRADVVDKRAFVTAIASRPELIHLVDPNLSALAHLARAQKSAPTIPGVRVWRERVVAASRRQ